MSLRLFSHIYIYSETVGGARERKLQENSTEIAVLLSAALSPNVGGGNEHNSLCLFVQMVSTLCIL